MLLRNVPRDAAKTDWGVGAGLPIIQCDVERGASEAQLERLSAGLSYAVQAHTGCLVDRVLIVIRELRHANGAAHEPGGVPSVQIDLDDELVVAEPLLGDAVRKVVDEALGGSMRPGDVAIRTWAARPGAAHHYSG
jgi:phenylpyruvate tautomerase PptA (4-oxalocrotonate tautomerase family)